MSVAAYVKSLLPTFESSKIKDNLTNLSQEIDQYTLPSVNGMLETFPKGWKWKDETVATVEKAVNTLYTGPKFARDANILMFIDKALNNLQSTMPLMKLQADKAFGRTVSAEGITFDRAAIVQYAEVCEFFVNYTRTFVNYLSAAELSKLEGSQKVEGAFPNDVEWLMSKRHTFAIVMNVAMVSPKDLKSELSAIPTAVVDEDNEEDMALVVGKGKMDPFGFAAVPFPLSIVYRVGLSMSEWQLNRYDRAQEEANVQQYRMILLKERMESGEGDAATERQLKDAEERLRLYRRKIAKMEEEYGLDE